MYSVLCLCGGDEAATDVGEVAVLALQSSLIELLEYLMDPGCGVSQHFTARGAAFGCDAYCKGPPIAIRYSKVLLLSSRQI